MDQQPKLLTTSKVTDFLGLKPRSLALWRVHKRGDAYLKLNSYEQGGTEAP